MENSNEAHPKTNPPATFRRDAVYERSHLFIPGDNVVVVFRITGQIAEDQLQKAIPELRRIHPMTGVHIEFDETRKAWFVSENTPHIPLKTIVRLDDSTWLQAVLEDYWNPFSITKGPLIRFLFVKGETTSEIVAFCQHAICDGLSLVFLLRDFMQIIGAPDIHFPSKDYLPTLAEAYDLNSIKLNPLIAKLTQKLNNLWEKNQISFEDGDFLPFYDAFRAQNINAVLWSLAPEITKKFVEICHQQKISVNSALYCAILQIQHQLEGDKMPYLKRIMMPINIRNYTNPPIGEGMGLFAGGAMFETKLNWKKPFWDQAQKIHKMLQKKITPKEMFSQAKRTMLLSPGMMDGRIMLFLGGLLEKPPAKYNEVVKIIEQDRFLAKMKEKATQNQIQYGTVLTNIGVVDIPHEYGAYKLESVILLPPSSPMAEKLIGVVTYKNQLQGALSFTERNLNKEKADQFATRLEEYIKKIVNVSL